MKRKTNKKLDKQFAEQYKVKSYMEDLFISEVQLMEKQKVSSHDWAIKLRYDQATNKKNKDACWCDSLTYTCSECNKNSTWESRSDEEKKQILEALEDMLANKPYDLGIDFSEVPSRIADLFKN